MKAYFRWLVLFALCNIVFVSSRSPEAVLFTATHQEAIGIDLNPELHQLVIATEQERDKLIARLSEPMQANALLGRKPLIRLLMETDLDQNVGVVIVLWHPIDPKFEVSSVTYHQGEVWIETTSVWGCQERLFFSCVARPMSVEKVTFVKLRKQATWPDHLTFVVTNDNHGLIAKDVTPNV